MLCKSIFLSAIIACNIFFVYSFTPVDNCGNDASLPDVTIEGCEETPCKVLYNQELSIALNFTAPRYLQKIKPSFKVKYPAFNWTFPLETKQKNACDGILNTPCPLVQNEFVQYKYTIKLAQLPYISFAVIFSIVDEDLDDEVICFSADMYPITQNTA